MDPTEAEVISEFCRLCRRAIELHNLDSDRISAHRPGGPVVEGYVRVGPLSIYLFGDGLCVMVPTANNPAMMVHIFNETSTPDIPKTFDIVKMQEAISLLQQHIVLDELADA